MNRRKLLMMGGNKLAGYSSRVLCVAPTNLIGYWPLDDKTGTSALNLKPMSGNVMRNPSFETLTGVGATDFWTFTLGAGGGTVEQDATDFVVPGLNSVKITNGSAANNTNLICWMGSCDLPLISGQAYTIKFYTKGDGTNQGKYRVYDNTNFADLVGYNKNTGVTAATWTQVIDTFTVPATCTNIKIFLISGADTNCIVKFDRMELIPTGVITNNGLYVGAGHLLGVPGIGDGRTAVRMNGADRITLYNPSLLYDINFDEGSALICWRYKTTADWDGGAGSSQALFDLSTLLLDATSDRIWMAKDVEGSPVQPPLHHSFFYTVTGMAPAAQQIEAIYPEDLLWHSDLFTWSKTNGRMRIYHDGGYPTNYLAPYEGPEDVIGTNMRGALLLNAYIGQFQGAYGWKGDLAHAALWNAELSPIQAMLLTRIH